MCTNNQCGLQPASTGLVIRKLALIVLLALLPVEQGQAQTVNTFVAGTLNSPYGIARAANGNLYVANSDGNTLIVITPDGTINTVLDSGLDLPNGVAIDSAGNVYVANTGNATVVKVTPGGNASVFAGAAQGLSGPRGLVFDPSDNLYVSDIGTRTILKITPGGNASTFVDDTNGFVTPSAMAFDAGGNMFVTDPGTAEITRITPAGAVSTFVSGFFSGQGLAFDDSGNLYSTGDPNGKIYMITPAGVKSDFASAFGPWGIVPDGAGAFYFTSYAGNTINKLAGEGVVSAFASNVINAPGGLVFAPNGDLFVANSGGGNIIEVTPHAQIASFASGFGRPGAMVRDSAGNIYVVDNATSTISKITPGGAVTPFATDVQGAMTIDAAGNIYIADSFANLFSASIQKITPAGSKSDFAVIQGQAAVGMVVDAAGKLYVATQGINFSTVHIQPEIVIFTPSATRTVIATGLTGPLALDSGGDLYVGVRYGGGITRIAPDGTQTAAVTDARIRSASAIAFDALGNLYVADEASNAVLQIVLVPSPLLSAVLPGSRSVEVGTPATVFSTILNTGSAALNNCRVFLSGTTPTNMSIEFQTTDPVSNALTGTKNQAVTIAGNGSQSYVLGFNATGPLLLPSMPLVYACDGASPAPQSPGVNTVDLLLSNTAVPDIIALAATTSNDGILNVPFSQQQRGAFAVATANVGSSATLTVSTDTAGAALPVSALVCPSDPVTAVCLQPEAASAQVTIVAGETPTFSVFVEASAKVPFAPETARIYLRFKGADGISHGSTSVAVRTQ